jgi:acetyl esterase/lipase
MFRRSFCLLAFSAFAFAQTVPDGVTLEKNVVYNQGSRLMMDVARPTAAGPFPVILAIHGGGFRGGERASWLPEILKLAQHGYVAATVDYRFAPRTQFPAPLQDVKAAVRFLRANAAKYAIDPQRIGAVGDSAGGHLALMLAFTPGVAEFESGGNRDQSSAITCAVSYYGPVDMVRLKSPVADQVLPLFLGGSVENAPSAYRLASPFNWITPLAPPVLAIHGTKDPQVPHEQSQWLVEQVKRVGGTAELLTIEGGGHGFDGRDAENAERRMTAFFDRHLGVTPASTILLVADHGGKSQVAALEYPSGRELWTVPNHAGHDVQPLPGGHVLYTIGNDHKVVEMDAAHQPVWIYEEGLEHPISAQRLANGNTLIGDAQSGKVIEVTPARKIAWTYASPDLANMRMRNSRRTEAGTTLIAVEAAGKIIEVNPAGEIVWTFEADGGGKRRPYRAVRLASGNTLIALNDPGEVVEVDRAGKIVRSIGGEKPDIRMVWVSGFDVMPSGNLLISDYQGRRVIEVDKNGKVVNEVRMPGRATASIALVP